MHLGKYTTVAPSMQQAKTDCQGGPIRALPDNNGPSGGGSFGGRGGDVHCISKGRRGPHPTVDKSVPFFKDPTACHSDSFNLRPGMRASSPARLRSRSNGGWNSSGGGGEGREVNVMSRSAIPVPQSTSVRSVRSVSVHGIYGTQSSAGGRSWKKNATVDNDCLRSSALHPMRDAGDSDGGEEDADILPGLAMGPLPPPSKARLEGTTSLGRNGLNGGGSSSRRLAPWPHLPPHAASASTSSLPRMD